MRQAVLLEINAIDLRHSFQSSMRVSPRANPASTRQPAATLGETPFGSNDAHVSLPRIDTETNGGTWYLDLGVQGRVKVHADMSSPLVHHDPAPSR